jgi:hypothetical protein
MNKLLLAEKVLKINIRLDTTFQRINSIID